MKIIDFFISILFFTSPQIVEKKEKYYALKFEISSKSKVLSKFKILSFFLKVWENILYLNFLIKKEIKIIVKTKKLFYKLNRVMDSLKNGDKI